ncbi:hypothetical protein SLI_5666 [Streptomyces lividans 1326]|uniref:Uncharacterized protein n=1 Tax=Streptomyces lividans 1326 TaxID=1200984 RepID=A0A7U9DUJ1_STRLI|nr:hypothetical protein SLI_5666 [Streptomyces lividans 1326]
MSAGDLWPSPDGTVHLNFGKPSAGQPLKRGVILRIKRASAR